MGERTNELTNDFFIERERERETETETETETEHATRPNKNCATITSFAIYTDKPFCSVNNNNNLN